MEGAGWKNDDNTLEFSGETEFVGYVSLDASAVIKSLVLDDEFVDSVREGDTCLMVLDKTPFYAESGGQVADDGFIFNENGGIARVDDVKK